MALKTVEEIEHAITALTDRERGELYLWLEEHYPEAIGGRVGPENPRDRLDAALQRTLDDDAT